jgi:nitrite reductase/ring-hydroxylating ferredoxin subunit
MSGTVLLYGKDPGVARRTARALAALELALITVEDGGEADAVRDAHPVVGVLVQVEDPTARTIIGQWRARVPEAIIVGYVVMPDAELWREMEAAGADAVTTRGRADRVLAERLTDQLSGRRRARRIRLAPLADFAGRLGFVGRIPETPVGAIALFHLSGRLWAVADACPHAGASLCEGELVENVITCPRHGSQFRVSDGERLRGPADLGLATFAVIIDAGEAFVELPPSTTLRGA